MGAAERGDRCDRPAITELRDQEQRDADGAATMDELNRRPVERPDLPGGGQPGFAAEERHWLPTYRQYRELESRAIGSPNAFVQPEQAEVWFDRLRNASVVLRANPIILPVEDTQLNVPRVSASGTAAMLAEGGSMTASDPTFAQISLLPRKGTYLQRRVE